MTRVRPPSSCLSLHRERNYPSPDWTPRSHPVIKNVRRKFRSRSLRTCSSYFFTDKGCDHTSNSRLSGSIGAFKNHLTLTHFSMFLANNVPDKQSSGREIARLSVESQRPSSLINYATAAALAIVFLATASAMEDNNIGIWRYPMTLRN